MSSAEKIRPAAEHRADHETSESEAGPLQDSEVRRLSDDVIAERLRLDTPMRRALRDVVPAPRKLEDLRTEVAEARIEQRRRRALSDLERVLDAPREASQ